MSAAHTWPLPRLLAIGAFSLGTVPADAQLSQQGPSRVVNARQSLPLRRGSCLLTR